MTPLAVYLLFSYQRGQIRKRKPLQVVKKTILVE